MIREQYTFCRVCECSCGLIATVENNTITSIRPNPGHLGSRGYACKKGLRFHEIVHSPDRLDYPLKRSGGSFERISWDDAIGGIASRLREIIEKHGPNSVALYAGSGAGFSLLHPIFAKGFMDALGSKNLFSASTIDCSNKFAVAELMYGSPYVHPIPDFSRAACFIVIGANPAASHMSFVGMPDVVNRLKAASAGGTRVVHVNPRRTESARIPGAEHFFIRPGTDVFFLLAFAAELAGSGGVDRDAVDSYMVGYDRFLSIVSPWSAERAAQVTGVPADTLRGLVRSYMKGPSSIYASTGINQSGSPTLSFWLVEAINAVSGNLDRRGGTLVGRGVIPLPGMNPSGPRAHSRVGNFRAVMECMPCAVFPDEVFTPGDGQIRALIVTGGNPALSFPGSSRMEKALRDLDLLVSIDIFRNETGDLAHFVLPAQSVMEHPDLNFFFQSFMGVSANPMLNYTDAVVEPAAERRDEIWIFSSLARAYGRGLFGSRIVGAVFGCLYILNAILGKKRAGLVSQNTFLRLLLRLTRRTSLGDMRSRPEGLPLGDLQEKSFLGKRVPAKSGKVDLAPELVVAAAGGIDAVFDREESLAGAIRVVNMRQLLSLNTYLHNAPGLMKGRDGNRIHMNPADAARAGLADGDLARVAGPGGDIVIPVRITDEMMPGAAAIPHGWGHGRAGGLTTSRAHPGANVNMLTASGPSVVDPVSGMAWLSAVPVEISREKVPDTEI